MNLKDFVKQALIEIDAGVTEAGKESHRDMFFAYGNSNKRTVEFDIAVTVEQNKAASGKSGLNRTPGTVGSPRSCLLRLSQNHAGLWLDRLAEFHELRADA